MDYEAKTRLSAEDPQIWAALQQEEHRQRDYLELIASENYASKAVLCVQGSVFNNKYAEGYPARRYYAGCEAVDLVENLAISRAQQLFHAEYINVQPHSGSQANAAVYLALLAPGETVLGMALPAGGHLTHGSAVNFSGKYFHACSYGVNREGYVDYDQVLDIARKEKPKLLIAGYSAYSRLIDWAEMRRIADEVGALFLVDMAHIAGPIAAGILPSPLPHAHVVTCTTHKTLAGPRGGMILSNVGDKKIYRRLDSALFPGTQGGPLPHVIAAKAVAFLEAQTPEFKRYQEQTLLNAKCMAEQLMHRGYPVVSGGTDVHMFLLDLSAHQLSGSAAEEKLHAAHITLNKNSVPNERRAPAVTSGVRIGTPAMTRRGMGSTDALRCADWIADLLDAPEDMVRSAEIREQVIALCRQYPPYADLQSCLEHTRV